MFYYNTDVSMYACTSFDLICAREQSQVLKRKYEDTNICNKFIFVMLLWQQNDD